MKTIIPGYSFEDCVGLVKTDKALLVRIPDLDDEIWIPQSHITDDSEVYKDNQSGTLVVSTWFATKKGWL